MDPATVIALCKENIQPLRHGRNATQLGTALRAQEDADAQQLLLEEKQMYEDAIKNYDGDDPLENWYEYILWVEQSYPKSGHESDIGKLLEQCLSTFEKETKYHQDRRYIRLWINYISMQKNPLELYQLLQNNGIGTMVADMYRAWAFELEQSEDFKRADEVYVMGIAARAQPLGELTFAHQNFQLAVGRRTLGRTDDRGEISLAEQRQAFSSLRAIRAGKKVGSIRTGHRVRDHLPGVVPQGGPVHHAPRGNSRIQIYQDDTLGGDIKATSILDHVPVEEVVHKENTIKAGPWSNASKKCPIMTSTVKPAFKVHEDQIDNNSDSDKLRLFSNHTSFFDGSKYSEHLIIPVFVPDPPNPSVIRKVHYPKELVYANNMDRSMEEIKAQAYLERAKALTEKQHMQESQLIDEKRNGHPSQCVLESQDLETEQREMEQQRLEVEQRRREAEQRELEIQRREAEHCELRRQRYETIQRELERLERERLEAERIEAERIEAERIEAQRMEAELSRQQKMQSTSYLHQHHTSADPEDHLLGQSLTVNTKEAMSVVQDLWHSSDTRTESPLIGGMAHRISDSRPKISFDIHMDSSMTQHAISSNKHLPGYNIQPYNDQENHHYPAPYTNQEHQSPYANHGYPNAYHFPMHHEQHVQPHRQHHPQHIPSPHQPPQQPHHPQAHIAPQHHHVSPHVQHQQHQQHHVYANISPSTMGYQPYHSSMHSSSSSHHTVDHQKQLHFTPYIEPEAETNKPYRMPSELPFIKSPGMNRRDLKYLEDAKDKENAIAVDYNEPVEENAPKQPEENNLYIDESLGIAPLSSVNDTCFTQEFNTQLTSSTPMTNHFRQPYRLKDSGSYQGSVPSQTISEVRASETDDKLSVIMESTREYISSSSGSTVHTRTAGLGFTLTREDMLRINGQSTSEGMESTESLLAANQSYEQKMRAQIQAVHAQSPRTVQRNVDEITSEIKNNCDLRKSISFKINNEKLTEAKDFSMDCEEHEPMEQVEDENFELPSGDINPFDKSLIAGLLKKIKFPQPYHAEGYVRLDTNLMKFVPSTTVTLGTDAYEIEKCLGKGTYGTVFKAVSLKTGQTVALKTQKPAWVWEYYIAKEVKSRLTNPHMLRGFMDITQAYVANNTSVLVSDFSKYGTLLAVTNQVKIVTGRALCEALAIFFTIEMLQIVEYLHKCQIIHGDIKPDNFLLMHLPTEDVRPTIQLIDFGCSIDMSLLPEDTKFTQVIKTEDFTCIEMQTGRPWTYQTDLYCLAASSHCLLFGNYMRVSNTAGRWFINTKLPRYMKKAMWEKYFTELLNIESCDKMPDLAKLRNVLEEILPQISELRSAIRCFSNILNKR
ncbi:uncharacterized protein LOC107269786 isoform X2 [Cephus cinctus]|uniref:Uncharacterized protein LOC107269786 isoform X2 n=1 Tax=Cephus cinctus TaxID=211228 RepID=A0AAJ7RM06_CEPCN|nr:uncharacterized protein LOC107269786 isoform X2 [Cephus cinctus]